MGRTEALSDVTVIDMASMLAAPFGAMLMADFGARVVKVEPPWGDFSRHHGWPYQGTSLWWPLLSRNKMAITLDLKKASGVDVMRRMLDHADVLIENMRPGKLEALGLDPPALWERNPGLIILRVTGWGQDGPYADRAAFGTQAEAQTGFAWGNGYPEGPPTLPSFPLADMVAGYLSAYAVMVALWARERDPERRGQIVDVSLFEALFGLLGPQASVFDKLGLVMERMGNRSPTAVPRNIYQTRDGRWLSISCSTDPLVRRAFQVIGRSDLSQDARFQTHDGRMQHVDELDALMQEWIGQHDLDEVVAQFSAAGAAVSPISTIKEILEDEHFKARQLITTVDSEFGPLKMQNVFPKLSRTPGSIHWSGRSLGADTDQWLAGEVGLSEEEINSLHAEGTI